MLHRNSGLGGLEAQLARKEKKWKELLATRINELESFLKTAWEEFFYLRQEELNQLYIQLLSKNRHNAAQHRLQPEELKRSMADVIQKQMEEYERMKRDLQCRIQEVEGELTLQRQEMTADFDKELRQQEHKFNLKMDEMRAVVLSLDLKVKLLSEETQVHRRAQLRTTEALKASKEFCQQIQTQLQHKDQEIKDLTAVKNYRIKELEDELKWMENKMKKEEDNHYKKYKNVARALNASNAQLEAQCQARTEQLQKAEEHIVKLQESMEVVAAQPQCIQEDQKQAMEQKDETLQRYKQHLSAGLKRERALEQNRVQVELEWQRRCEDIKAEYYLANEQIIQDLTWARDQAKAELKEKEQELQDLTVLLRSASTERDQAIQGLTPTVDSQASEEIRHLQEQNGILRAVVAQMRKDMEGLGHLLPPPHTSTSQQVQHQGAPAAASITPTANISSSVSPAGGLCLEKCANASPLTKPEFRVGHILEQCAQLQEGNLYLRKQQASGLVSGGLFENVPPLLHTRLKQAAFCIVRLSKEKQQLIEMGNCLRAQITAAGLQEPVEPGRDSSTEKLEDQHDWLFALEQLQYQLTTQELQYGLRHRVCTFAEQLVPGTNSPATKGAANPWSQGRKTTNKPESSKNKENTPPSQSLSSLDEGPQPRSGLSGSRLSSEESLRSLNELWKVLDHGLRGSSIFSEGEGDLSRREVVDSGGAGVQMMVHGISAPIHSQPPTEFQQRRNPSTTPSTKTSRPGVPNRISKIRNYNVKD